MYLADTDFKHYMELKVEKEQKDKILAVSSVDITGIRLNDIAEYIYEHLDPENNLRDPSVRMTFDGLPDDLKRKYANNMLIYRYCIHRILTKYRLWDKKNWRYHLMDDYFSQEVSAVTLRPEVADSLSKCLLRMNTLSNSRKIEYMLELEYGKVLPGLVNGDWSVTTIPMDKLYYTNPKLHEESVAKGPIEYLNYYRLPRGLCVRERVPDGFRYRVVDGYSRLADLEARNVKECLVIVRKNEN